MTELTPEEERRAKVELLLRDLELRGEQVRQMKSFEGWRLVFQGFAAGAAVFVAGVAVATLVFHLAGRI